MATTLEELVFKFEADLSSLKTGLVAAQASVEKLEKTVQKSAGKMGAALGGMSKLFKLDLLIRYGQQLINVEDQMEILASTIKDTSDRADLGAEALQRLRHVADQNGTSAEAMDSALIRLNKAMGLARLGAEGMREIFAAMGLEDLIDKGAGTEEMFYAIADSVSHFKDETKASAVVAKIMGREADRLIETFKLGGPEAKRIANSLRGVIPQEMIDKLDTSRDRTEEFKKTLNAIGATLSSVFVDGLIWIGRVGAAIDKATEFAKVWANTMQGLRLAIASWGPEWMQEPSSATPSGERKNATAKHGIRGGPTGTVTGGLAAGGRSPDEAKLGTLLGGDTSKEAAKEAEHYSDVLSDLNFELAQLKMSETEAANAQELRNAISQAGVSAESQRGQAIAAVVKQLQDARAEQAAMTAAWEVEAAQANRALAEMHEKMRETAAEWDAIGANIEDKLSGAFVEMAANMENAGEIAAQLAMEIGKLILKTLLLKAIEEGVNAVFGPSGGGNVGGFAAGGTLNPGNAYQLHKNEVMIPRVPMSVVPAGRGMGGNSVVINAPLTASAGVDRATMEQLLARHKQDLAKMVPRIVAEQNARGRLRLA